MRSWVWCPYVAPHYFPPREFSLLERSPGEGPQLGLTLGTFDGCHQGHQALISALNRAVLGSKSYHHTLALSLYPHPRSVLASRDAMSDPSDLGNDHRKLITPLRSRIKAFEKTGVDELGIVRFNKSFSSLSAEEFIEHILIGFFSPQVIVVGYDWNFGRDRKGGLSELSSLTKKQKIMLVVVPKQEMHGEKISSTNIREHLAKGEVEEVAELLGRNFSICGRVVHGKSRGRSLGFPTANLNISRQLYPMNGVYQSQVRMGDEVFPSITNIGRRPTFKTKDETLILAETHILDFDQSIYGNEIEVELISFIRKERRFSGVNALKDQIHKDLSEVRSRNKK